MTIMKDLEKNDVDISKLFNWGDSIEIIASNGKKVKVYVRLVGDFEVSKARVYALRKSAELRKKLRDPTTDEYLAFIPELTENDKDKIIEILVLLNIKELTNRAENNLNLKYPKEPPSDAPLEELEKYQEEIDNWPKTVEKEISKALDKEIEAERKLYKDKGIEELKEEYVNIMINKACEAEMYSSFQDMCVYFACYKDKNYKERLFNSIDEFLNLPSSIKNTLIDFYNTLTINMDELKK